MWVFFIQIYWNMTYLSAITCKYLISKFWVAVLLPSSFFWIKNICITIDVEGKPNSTMQVLLWVAYCPLVVPDWSFSLANWIYWLIPSFFTPEYLPISYTKYYSVAVDKSLYNSYLKKYPCLISYVMIVFLVLMASFGYTETITWKEES